MKLALATVIASIVTLTGATAHAQRTSLPVPQCSSFPTDLFNGQNHYTETAAPYDTSCPWTRGQVQGELNFTTDDCWYDYDPSWNSCRVTCETPLLDITMEYGVRLYPPSEIGFWNIETYYLSSPSIYGQPYCWEDAQIAVFP